MRLLKLDSVLVLFTCCAALFAQTPPEAVPAGTRVNQLPLSGRTEEQSVQTDGSIPTSARPGPLLQLSLDEAVRRGLQSNLGTVAFQNLIRQAQGLQQTSRAELMPQISGGLMFVEEQVNLDALGFGTLNNPAFGSFPTVIGPFHYVDARAGLYQSIFDLVRLKNFRASRENVRSSQFSSQDTRDVVVLAVTSAYLQIIASAARIESVKAQVATAQALYQQASDRYAAGTAPRIDATRSQVELQTQQQRLIAAQNDFAKLKISLARLIGLPAGQEFALSDTLPFAPVRNLTLEQAITRAYTNRADLKAAQSQIQAAELTRQGAVAERLPTLEILADYGAIGVAPQNSHGTFNFTTALRFPIWQGGRIHGDIVQAEAALQQRRSEYQDLRGRVDADIRTAFLDLTSAAAQVAVAQSNQALANDTLRQSRDRFAAGVADTVEVVQSQEQVATAEQNLIDSLFQHNLAKANLARSMGQADQGIKEFLSRQ